MGRGPAVEPMLIGARDAAKLLAVSVRHFYALDARGQIPEGMQLGRRRLWALQELRQWVAAGCPSRDKWAVIRGGER